MTKPRSLLPLLLLPLSLPSMVAAFSFDAHHRSRQRSSPPRGKSLVRSSSSFAASSDSDSSKPSAMTVKPMSPQEILEKQRAKKADGGGDDGAPDSDDYPKLYSDELLDDMRNVLRLLERRANGGIGSIGSDGAERFAELTKNILDEMKEAEYERLADASSPAAVASPAAAVTVPATTTPPPAAAPTTVPAVATTVTEPEATATKKEDEEYKPEVEGPDYDPAGGQGSIPKDTTNTYIIPGMDAMSPEEYRTALQESIKARQSQRKASGKYGNRNTWDYLNNLSGDTGVLKKDDDDDDSLEN